MICPKDVNTMLFLNEYSISLANTDIIIIRIIEKIIIIIIIIISFIIDQNYHHCSKNIINLMHLYSNLHSF